MSRRTLLALCALCLVAVSCSSSFQHVRVRAVSEAEYLKAEVTEKRLMGEDINRADSLLAIAKTNNVAREAADYADFAAALYRAALAKQSLEESAAALKQAEAALAASREQVDRYQDILNGINAKAEAQ